MNQSYSVAVQSFTVSMAAIDLLIKVKSAVHVNCFIMPLNISIHVNGILSFS